MKVIKSLINIFVKLIPSAAIIIFNLTNLSIINPIREHIFKLEPMIGTSRVSVDSAIVAMIFVVIMSIFKKQGNVYGNIRNEENYEEYKLPRIDSGRQGKLKIDCQITYNNSLIQLIIKKLGTMKLIIKNEEWTSIEIENFSEYSNVNIENASEKIEIQLNNTNRQYYELLLASNKSVRLDGYIQLDIEHSNKFINCILKGIFDIKCNKQKIIY